MKFKFKILLLFAFISICTHLNSQKAGNKISISGIVTDTVSKPVEHALIYIDGRKTKFFTNSNGAFEIRVSPKSEKIGIVAGNCYGEAEIEGKTQIKISIKAGDTGLKKVKGKSYVPSGRDKSGIEEQKRILTSYSDIYNMIRSEVPGVRIEGTRIFIQGTKTYAGDNAVLFVVDGVPVDQISGISPYDVESFRLIKDSEAAIYGIRGANGVLVITTKSGGDK